MNNQELTLLIVVMDIIMINRYIVLIVYLVFLLRDSCCNQFPSIPSSTPSSMPLKVSITDTNDFNGNATYCDTNNTVSMLCNVRSAFMYCNLYSNTSTSCHIGKLIY